jgi:putative ABC transport system ATP-binding protein
VAQLQPGQALTIAGLTKAYGLGASRVEALRGVDLAIESGQWTSLVGPSGAGKTTLLYCLAGIEQATSGSIVVGTTHLANLNAKQLADYRRDHVGMVFESFNLLPTLTVEENIRLSWDIRRQAGDGGWYDRVLTVLNLADLQSLMPADLSRGQQVRVACARAAVGQPDFIIADEPTGELNWAGAQDVLNALRLLVDSLGQTLLLATHDARVAARSQRVAALVDGQVLTQVDQPGQEAISAMLAPSNQRRVGA